MTEYILMDRSLLEAAAKEIRVWKVDKGGDDQVVLNIEAALNAPQASDPAPFGYVVEERRPPRFTFHKTRPSISDDDMNEFEITIDPVFLSPPL